MQGKNAIAKILKMEGVEFISGFPQNLIFEAAAEEGIRTFLFGSASPILISAPYRFFPFPLQGGKSLVPPALAE